ncbi:MAG: large conductance mechanosensitive channel protein MscL [Clostridiales Family XIII bacterium]|jgi:large conductance mechanosensitive channel|nr:large conductance mechanosensitive channel protein MscL [Clostridiales Family XIII bacterium]
MKRENDEKRRKQIKKALDHRGILIEFKDFALRGNVMDMAVAAVIALAFGGIVNSLVNDIILQFIGSIVNIDYSNLSVTINGIDIMYGKFITAVVNFFVVAIIMFVAIKFINLFTGKRGGDKDDPAGGAGEPDDQEE